MARNRPEGWRIGARSESETLAVAKFLRLYTNASLTEAFPDEDVRADVEAMLQEDVAAMAGELATGKSTLSDLTKRLN